MDVLLTKVAGIDVHKKQITVTTLVGEANQKPKKEQFVIRTFTEDLREFGQKLLSIGVCDIAMESTGVYWKPVFNVLKPMGFNITLGNSRRMKNVPGRKTDANDSEWIAQLHRNGLIPASYVPDTEFHQLRALTRHRRGVVNDIARVKNRLQKVLEDGNIKLASVLSDVFSQAGIAVIEALCEGIDSPNQLADRVKTRVKLKEDIPKALSHCLRRDHIFLIKEHYTHYKSLKERLLRVEEELEDYMDRHKDVIARLEEVPGVSKTLAHSIVAEATTEMKNFKDDRTFAAWAGVAPGNNESAGKKKEQNQEKGIQTLKKL